MNESYRIAGNQVTLLQNGEAYFPQLCADISAAQESIYLETYIFSADEAGRRVADALKNAARCGVSVRVLLDGFGSAELPQAWLDELREAGVEVQWFRREISPFTFQPNRKRRILRLHRKLAVIDGYIAFAGGINIINDIPEGMDSGQPRLDYAVRIQGVLALEIQAAIRHLWGLVLWANLRKRGKEFSRIPKPKEKSDTAPLIFLLRDNLRHRRDIERAYLKAISTAESEIILANAYFLPGRLFRRALKLAARRGVRVVLLLQGRVEYRLQHYATHALYEELLSMGIEIYEYQASYLHAKVAVVDGQWATVGSSNIDPISLLLAREANIVLRDAGIAGSLRASLMEAIAKDARRISKEDINKRNIIIRIVSRLSYAAMRLVLGFLGYSRHS